MRRRIRKRVGSVGAQGSRSWLPRFGAAAVLVAGLSSCSPAPSPASQELTLSCGGSFRFRPGDVDNGLREPVADQAGAALTAFLARPEAALLPKAGWIRVRQTDARTLFLGPVRDVDAAYATVEMVREGGDWRADTWGGCSPRFGNDAVEAARWGLAAAPDPGATHVDLLVIDPNCARFREEPGPVLPPLITDFKGDVAVTLLIARNEPVGAVEGCAGNPAIPYRLDLKEVLGNRMLLDGGTFPVGAAALVTPDVDGGDASPGVAPR